MTAEDFRKLCLVLQPRYFDELGSLLNLDPNDERFFIDVWRFGLVDLGRSNDEFWAMTAEELHALADRYYLLHPEAPRFSGGKASSEGSASEAGRQVNRMGRPKRGEIHGDRVRSLRGEEASQKAFARLCRISPETLQKAERGSASEKTLFKICKYVAKKGIIRTPEDLQKKPPAKSRDN